MLSEIGGEYQGFADRRTEPFDLPPSAALTSVLNQLQRNELVRHESIKNPMKRRVWLTP